MHYSFRFWVHKTHEYFWSSTFIKCAQKGRLQVVLKSIQEWLLSHLNQCVEKLLKHITIIEIINATIQHKLL